jgi:anti-sigma factor RsiW
MMRCSQYAVWIARKLDGSLAARNIEELEEHLAHCSRCRAELHLQKKILGSLKQEMPSGLSSGFTQRVSARAVDIARSRRRNLRLPDLVPVLAVAAAAVLLLAFRTDLARVVPPLMTAFAESITGPLASVGDGVLRVLAALPAIPSEHTAFMDRMYKPLMTSMTAVAVACVAVLWAFSRVRAFLRD